MSKIFQWKYQLFLAVACVVPYFVHAVPVAPADYTDFRFKAPVLNPDGGITANGSLVGPFLPYSLIWNMTDNGGGSFNYFYQMSNIIPPLTSLLQGDFFVETDPTIGLGDLTNIQVNGGLLNPAVSVSETTLFGVHGILFDVILPTVLISTVSFDAVSAPVYGDFAHGSFLNLLGWVENTGFGTAPGALINYIATPGVAAVVVPEPTTMLILGSSLVLAFTKRSRKSEA
ncbi:MAG: PEP-CTERM sorting domain-containing protein [Chlamydiales bacterium]|nr:PEP-CTERM sorting domain-containing protein [Chlamydiales bacterium]